MKSTIQTLNKLPEKINEGAEDVWSTVSLSFTWCAESVRLRTDESLSSLQSKSCSSNLGQSVCVCIIHIIYLHIGWYNIYINLCVGQRCVCVCFTSGKGYWTLLGRVELQLSAGVWRSRVSIMFLTLCLCSSVRGGCRTLLWIWMNKRKGRIVFCWVGSERRRKAQYNDKEMTTQRHREKEKRKC